MDRHIFIAKTEARTEGKEGKREDIKDNEKKMKKGGRRIRKKVEG